MADGGTAWFICAIYKGLATLVLRSLFVESNPWWKI